MMTLLSNTFSPSSVSLLIHPSPVPFRSPPRSLFLCKAQQYQCLFQSRLLHEPGVHVLLLLERVQSCNTGRGVRERCRHNPTLPSSLLPGQRLLPFLTKHAHKHPFLLNPTKAGYTHPHTHIYTTLFFYIREYFCQVGKRQKLRSKARLVSAGECKSLRRKEKQKHNCGICRFSGIHKVKTTPQQIQKLLPSFPFMDEVGWSLTF